MYYCLNLYSKLLDALPGYKFLEKRDFPKDKCPSGDYRLLEYTTNDKKVCAKMCNDAVECTAFEYKDGDKCHLLSWCGEEQTKRHNDWNVYLKGKKELDYIISLMYLISENKLNTKKRWPFIKFLRE